MVDSPLSNLVKYQIPAFIREEHPLFITFAEAYFEWLEQSNQATAALKGLLDNQDIDLSIDAFLEYFRREFMANIPKGIVADKRLLLKHVRQFYRARGTEKSFELFFRIMFNEKLDFRFPREEMLKVSDGKWIEEKSLKVIRQTGSPFDFTQRTIRGATSGATAKVEKVFRQQQGLYDVYEVFLLSKEIDGNFQVGEIIEPTTSGVSVTAKILPVFTGAVISNEGFGYSSGQPLTFTSSVGDRASAQIKKVSKTGGIKSIKIVNHGAGYYQVPTIYFPATDSGQLSAIDSNSVVKLADTASTTDSVYNGGILKITSGAASGQELTISSYGGTFRQAILSGSFSPAPAVGDQYEVITARATATVGALCEYPGYFWNDDGQLDVARYIQDSFYYQQYSYVLISSLPLRTYRTLIKELLHPLGLALFGMMRHEDTIDLGIKFHKGDNITDVKLIIASKSLIPASEIRSVASNMVLKKQSKIHSHAYPIGPTLRSIERDKWKYLPTTLKPNANNQMAGPNSNYWNGDIANYQLKDFSDEVTFEDFELRSYLKTNIAPEPTIWNLNPYSVTGVTDIGLTATASLPAPTVKTNVVLSPQPQVVQANRIQPLVIENANPIIQVSVQVASASVPAATVDISDVTLVPVGALVASASFQRTGASAKTGSRVLASARVSTASLPTPAVITSGTSTAYTSAANGNWNNPATWSPQGIPTSGDTVTVSHTVTVTDTQYIGHSPQANDPTPAIKVTSAGNLTIGLTRTLICRGDVELEDGTFTMNAGSIFEFDASQAATPATAIYKFKIGTGHWQDAYLDINGGAGVSRCNFRSNAGGANGYITDSGYIMGGQINATYCNFTRIGDATNPMIEYMTGNGGAFEMVLDNCLMNYCGQVLGSNHLGEDTIFKINHCTFQNSLHPDNCIYIGCYGNNTTGTREIIDTIFDKWCLFYPATDLTIEDCYFHTSFICSQGENGPWASFRYNFVRMPFGESTYIDAIAEDCYFYKDWNGINPHFIQIPQFAGRNTTVRNCIFEFSGTNEEGDCILIGDSTLATTCTITGNIYLPNASGGASGTGVSMLGGSNMTVIYNHNTMVCGSSGISIGETYVGHQDMLASFKSNIFYNASGPNGYKLVGMIAGASTQDMVSPANADYNCGYNLNAGTLGKGYTEVLMSGAPGANDDDRNPQFVDATRDLQTWELDSGGGMGAGDPLSSIRQRMPGFTVRDLLIYIRGGFTPQASNLTGHDGTTIGAIAV